MHETKLILVVDTNRYAGNFSKKLVAYALGIVNYDEDSLVNPFLKAFNDEVGRDMCPKSLSNPLNPRLNAWSLFKRGLSGLYHHVSAKYLQEYLDEFSFRYSHRHEKERLMDLVLASCSEG